MMESSCAPALPRRSANGVAPPASAGGHSGCVCQLKGLNCAPGSHARF